MKLKGITDEDFINYRAPSMFIATATCSFKCDKEYGTKICQNSLLALSPNIEISSKSIVHRYLSNRISKAIVFGGLEPIEQAEDVYDVINYLRNSNHPKSNDPVIIYTGYTKEEVIKMFSKIEYLYSIWSFKNIIFKFGRYIPGDSPHFDDVLGVYLASDNQYAERIS